MRRRLGRASALFLVGALTLLPVSARAAPPGDGVVTHSNENTAPGPGNSGDAPGQSDDKSKGDDKSRDNPTRTRRGFGSVDTRLLPAHLGAAIVMFDQADGEVAPIPAMGASRRTLSGSVSRTLAPVLPPVLVTVVTSPVVVIEALIAAMASSGQALVIPLVVGAAGLLRRKGLFFAEALGPG